MNAIHELEPGLISLVTFPHFGIGQRAMFLRTPHGNVLWDCIALVDRATIEMINGMGGIKAIAISHPHYYTTMVEWSEAFGGVPVYLHLALARPDQRAPAGPHPDLLRRALPGRHRTALAGGRRRQGRAPVGRHRTGRAGQQIGELHVELPELHPTIGPARRRRCEFAQVLRVRPHSRRFRGPNDLVGRKRRA
jgi:hypothetical protein